MDDNCSEMPCLWIHYGEFWSSFAGTAWERNYDRQDESVSKAEIQVGGDADPVGASGGRPQRASAARPYIRHFRVRGNHREGSGTEAMAITETPASANCLNTITASYCDRGIASLNQCCFSQRNEGRGETLPEVRYGGEVIPIDASVIVLRKAPVADWME